LPTAGKRKEPNGLAKDTKKITMTFAPACVGRQSFLSNGKFHREQSSVRSPQVL